LFITFEGPDGSGKTTQLHLLVAYLRERGHTVFPTREPGGTPIGDQIRAVLHDLRNENMHPHTEILLYAASRAQLVAEAIRPRLAAGEIVICDRYADSTLASAPSWISPPGASSQTSPSTWTLPQKPDCSAASRRPRTGLNGTAWTRNRWPFTDACAMAICN